MKLKIWTAISLLLSAALVVNAFAGTSDSVAVKVTPFYIYNVSVAPSLFSPNNDGIKDTVAIKANITVSSSWTINIKDSLGSIKRVYTGTGAIIDCAWDGKDTLGKVLVDGIYTYTIDAQDPIGGSTAKQTQGQITLDITAPETTITKGPSGNIDYADVTFEWSAADSSGIAGYSYWLDANSPTDTAQTTVTFTNLPEGSHTFNIQAKDNAGNIDLTPGQRSFQIKLIVNVPPQLYDPKVTPIRADNTATFTYSVYYYDANNDVPVLSQVIIDTVAHNMALASGAPANGLYTYSTTLITSSVHSYYFVFKDQKTPQPITTPSLADYRGPIVMPQTGVLDLLIDDFSDTKTGANSLNFATGDDATCVVNIDIDGSHKITWDKLTAYWYTNLWDTKNPLNACYYNKFTFQAKGAVGSEAFQIELQDTKGKEQVLSNDYITLAASWQQISIPLNDLIFQGIDIRNLKSIGFLFKEQAQGTIFIDDLKFSYDSALEYSPPNLPVVKPRSTGPVGIAGRDLLVNSQPFLIKAVGYQPIPVGFDFKTWDPSNKLIYQRDLPILKTMGVNAIKTWSKVTKELLDIADESGIKVCAGYYVETTLNLSDSAVRQNLINDFSNYVTAFKNHPALIMWVIGNEQNYYNGDNADWYALVNEMAKAAYLIEGNAYHPVAINNGDIFNVSYARKKADDASLSYVDMWALNVYRGVSFGELFYDSNRRGRTSKPIFIAEYGVDAYDNTNSKEDQTSQSLWDCGAYNEIAFIAECSGGALMEYSDEWWKLGVPSVHDNSGFPWPEGRQPDNFSNEEWYGIVSIKANAPGADIVAPRKVYTDLGQRFRETTRSFVNIQLPQAPVLTAVALSADVSLSWASVVPPSISGYCIYKSKTSASGYERIAVTDALTKVYNDKSLSAGKYYYVVTSYDSSMPAVESSLSNEASAVVLNQKPKMNSIGNQTVNENNPIVFQVTASDDNNDKLTYSASNLPTGATFDPASQLFSWIPTHSQVKIHTGIHFEVTDGLLKDVQDISIEVKDITPPAAPVITAPLAGWQNSDITQIQGTAEAGAAIKAYNNTILLAGSAIADASGNYTLTLTVPLSAEISYSLTTTAADTSGNISAPSSAVIVKIDKTKPVTIDSGIDANWHNASVTITLVASDPGGSGADKTYYSSDGSNPSIIYTVPFAVSSEGAFTVKYYSTDKAGNAEVVKIVSNQVKIDKTAPTGSVLINNNDAHTNTTSVTLTISANDATSGIDKMSFSNDNITWSSPEAYSVTKAWILSAGDGDKTVYAKFTDKAGNATTAVISDSILLDTIPPALNIASPANNSKVTGTVNIQTNTSDITSGVKKVEFYIDTALIGTVTVSPYSYSWNTASVVNGFHIIKVVAVDNANNTNSTQITVDVYNSVNAKYSVATISGYQLLVQKRKADGTLEPSAAYIIKGAAWSPASIGIDGSTVTRRAEFAKWIDTDAPLMKTMFVNTVRTYIDFGTTDTALQILDKLYQNGIMAIVGVDSDGRGDVDNALAVVAKYRDHPAILMWMVGNEWNINCFGTVDPAVRAPTTIELQAAAAKAQDIATRIKVVDPNHLVATGYGDLAFPDLNTTKNFVQNACTSVDVWGINVYRGATFGTTFTDWKSISAKPMFISEFGTDSYKAAAFGAYPITGSEDEQMQSDFNVSLWMDLYKNLSAKDSSKVALGGAVFSWNDEWWKVNSSGGGDNSRQDNGGYYTTWNKDAFPDGCGNEEYFGIVKISRAVKKAYNELKTRFDPAYTPPTIVEFKAVSKGTNPGTTQWDTYAKFYKDGAMFYDKRGDLGGRGINIAVINSSTGAVEDTKVFDTYLSAANSDAMVTYLNGVASNKILMFAIADEAISSLTESAKQALEALGSKNIRSVNVRDSWAMVTKKGLVNALAEQYGVGEKTAIATINLGASMSSIIITSPADGFITNKLKVTLQGTVDGVAFSEEKDLANEGSNVVSKQATDAYGNAIHNFIFVTRDTVPPSCTIKINNDNLYANSLDAVLNLSAEDVTSGMNKMSFSVDNVNWTSPVVDYAVTYPWKFVSGDGIKTVWAKVADKAGNASSVTSDTITLDTIAPSVDIKSPPNPYITVKSYRITGNKSSDVTSVVFEVVPATVTKSAIAYTATTWECQLSNLPEGITTPTVYCQDLAGNYSPIFSSSLVVDTIVPSAPALTMPAPLLTNKAALNFEGTKDANSSIVLKSDELGLFELVPIDRYQRFVSKFILKEGVNHISIMSKDYADNQSLPTTLTAITLDTAPPIEPTVNNIFSPANNPKCLLTGTKEVNSSVWINNKEAVELDILTTWSYVLSLSEGANSINIFSIDAAGNMGKTVTKTVTLDTIPPAMPAINSVATPTDSSTQTLTGAKSSDTTAIYVECPTAAVSIVTYPTSTTWSCVISNMADGKNRVSVVASDALGNQASPIEAIIEYSSLTNLTFTPGNEINPDVAILDDNIFVVWQDASDAKVYLKRSQDKGATWQLTAAAVGSGNMPKIAVDKACNVYVVTGGGIGTSAGRIYLSKSTDKGATFSSGVEIGDGFNPIVGVSDDGSKAYVAWYRRESDNKTYTVQCRASGDGGKTFAPAAQVSDDKPDEIGHQNGLDIAVSSSGKNVYCVFSRRYGSYWMIALSRSFDYGAVFDADLNLTDMAHAAYFPQIAVNGNNIYAVWQHDTLAYSHIWLRASSDNGQTFSSATRIDDGASTATTYKSSAIAIDTRGAIYTAFVNATSGADLYMDVSPNEGQDFKEDIKIGAASSGVKQETPQIAVNSTGSLLCVVWADNRNGNSDIYIRNFKSSSPVDWLKSQMGSFGFVDSFESDGKDLSNTYDQALAAIAFTEAGEAAFAKKALDALKAKQNADGSWYSSYDINTGQKLDTEDSKYVGRIAWVIIAVNFYTQSTGDISYVDMAKSAAEWIYKYFDNSPKSSTYGSVAGGILGATPITWRSTEHALDVYSAFKYLQKTLDENKLAGARNYGGVADLIRGYLMTKMYNSERFLTGWEDNSRYLDVNTLAILSLGICPNNIDIRPVLNWAADNFCVQLDWNASVKGISGFDETVKYNELPNKIWFEGTEQAVSAYHAAGRVTTANFYHKQVKRVQQANLSIPYSTLGAGAWPRLNSVSATCWFYFNERQPAVNPMDPTTAAKAVITIDDFSDILPNYNTLGFVTSDDKTCAANEDFQGTRHIIWNANTSYWYSLLFGAPQSGMDITLYKYLSFKIKSRDVDKNFSVRIESAGNKIDINIKDYVQLAGEWQYVNIPILDFILRGLDTSTVRSIAFAFNKDASGEIWFDNLRLSRQRLAPFVNMVIPSKVYALIPAQFTSAASGDYDGGIMSYEWDFQDGCKSDESNPYHTYLAPGNYKISLKVKDNDGIVVIARKDITVEQAPLVSGSLVFYTNKNDELIYSGDITYISIAINPLPGQNLQHKFKIDGSIVQDYNVNPEYIWDTGTAPLGKHFVEYDVKDEFGNTANRKAYVWVYRRPIAPPGK